MTVFELRFPTNLDADDVTALIRSLSGRPRGGILQRTPPVIFELVATSRSVEWFLHLPEPQCQLVLSRLRAHLPNIRVSETALLSPSSKLAWFALELRVTNPGRPLRTDVADQVAASMMAAVSGLGGGEVVCLRWMLGPALARRVARPTPKSAEPGLLERLLGSPSLDSEAARRRNEKQAEPVFGTLGRIAVAAASKGRRRQLVAGVLGALRQTSQASVQLTPRRLSSTAVLRRIDRTTVPRIEWPCVLNAAELASVIGWPIGGPVAAGVSYGGRRELPFPQNILLTKQASIATKLRPELDRRDRVIGEATYPGRHGRVLLSATDALQHTHIIGPTGVGKSTLLANLALSDITAGRGVVVIEPKGDLISDILDRIPKRRYSDVVLLDPDDSEQPVGLSLVGGGTHNIEVAVDAVVHLFRTMFASSWGPRTQDVLHAALLTLANTPGMTLVEVPLLLSDARFRHRLVAKVDDPLVLGPFWAWFDALSAGERSQVIAPVLNKVRAFTMRSSVRGIIGQAHPKFHMREVFAERRILLVPLRRGVIGPETANLLGGLVVAQLWQAAQERSAIEAKLRHPVMLYLDEFQSYLHLPTDLSDVLAEARGLGLGLTLAHQNLGQLTKPELKSAVMVNARSRVVFQSSNQDAVPLAKSLGGGLEPKDITALAAFEAYARLMVNGSSTTPGSLITLPLPESLNSAASVRARSARQFGQSAEKVREEMLQRQAHTGTAKSGGRRKRRP